ncbi:MAG: exodeoxyribonuclease VII large subunit [Myxococcales bacterium]|nr:exodeoxyribonuclease VII large subunit [Myxococcales bacterium]
MADRTIDLDAGGENLLISSEYNDEIRLTIKGFAGARWDSANRVWCVPVSHTAALLEGLSKFEFELLADLSTGPTGDGPAPAGSANDDTLSISQLNTKIRIALAQEVGGAVWVKGELSSFDKGADRAHWYFDLVEKDSNSERITARISATVFNRERTAISAKLNALPEPIRLTDGLEVRMRGRLDYYSPNGRLQFIVDDIDPNFSLGEMARRREEILRQLESDGLLAKNTRLTMPVLPLRVGLITAPNSDALHDVVRTLSSSGFAFEVFHYPATVQGPRCEQEILTGLQYFESGRNVDCVLLVRGGGARSDLAWLDNLAMARAIANMATKVVVGIGHQRDQSVLDFVASSEKTPTAAAELLVSYVSAQDQRVSSLASKLTERVTSRMRLEAERAEQRRHRLLQASKNQLDRSRVHLDHRIQAGLTHRVDALLRLEKQRLGRLASDLRPTRVLKRVTTEQERHLRLRRRLERGCQVILHRVATQLDAITARVEAADPKRVLARGYSVVYDQYGGLVRSLTQIEVDNPITLSLSDGQLTATVTEKHGDPDADG